MSGTCETTKLDAHDYALALADDALILGHRLSEWAGKAPTLEEDLALANTGLDLIGQSRALYQFAGEKTGASEDDLAYKRDAGAYRNLLICELPNGDFAFTAARQFLYSAMALPFWQALGSSKAPMLAAIAAKAEKEAAYHLRHASEWLIRLGDGTDESRGRSQAALDAIWMWTGELFDMSEAEKQLASAEIAVDRTALAKRWNQGVDSVLAEATLRRPRSGWMQKGGRGGRHTEHLGFILAELQFLPRAYPGAIW